MRQYLAEYDEAEDESDELDDTFDALIIDTKDINTIDIEGQSLDEVDHFMTSFGEIKAVQTYTNLADHAFTHSLVRTVPVSANANQHSDLFAYVTTTQRYTADRFYGVMIDTGAFKRSTAGWDQFQAYQKNYGATIDTTTAGAVNV